MKPHYKPLATALAATLQLFTLHFSLLTLHAAVPLAWDVRPGQPAPVTFDRYHGETLSFSATFRSFGELPFAPGADIRLWFQTNGMGSAWWSVPATVQSNVLSAVWSPERDPGAERVSLFFGAPSNAYAAAVLRLRHSPGFTPNTLPPPAVDEFEEADPVFSAWLAGYTPPDTSLAPATNYTDQAIASHSHSNISDADGNRIAADRRVTVVVPAVRGGWVSPGNVVIPWVDAATGWKVNDGVDSYLQIKYADGTWTLYMWENSADTYEASDQKYSDSVSAPADATSLLFPTDGLTYTRQPDTPASTTTDTLSLSSDVTAASNAAQVAVGEVASDLSDLRTESALIYRLYSGSNVVVEVTNYNSQVHAPELRLLQLNESNEYITVWTETNGLARTLKSANAYTDDATGAVARAAAPRAWSRTTSGLGFDAPDGMTWVSTSNLVIAGGLEYEKHVTSGGAIWLLESNGMAADFHASANNTAYLDISAADGTSIFRIEKTDSFLVGVNVDNVSVENGNTLVCGVNVVATDHPLVRVRASLSSGEWLKEEDGIPASLATVTWSGTTGNWTCRIQNNTGGGTIFAQMEYFQEGGTKIVNSAALDVSEGILCTDGIHKCRPVYSSAGGGTITWEVVR